tara:strand:- start:3239 stop:3724 length:486 start_codon:yes stop_codon:yes gene_type:complete
MPIRKLSQQEIEDRQAAKPLRSTRQYSGHYDTPYWVLRGSPSNIQEAYNNLNPEHRASFNESQKGILQILLEDKLTSSPPKPNPYEYGTRESDLFMDSSQPEGVSTNDLKDMVFERLGIRVFNTDIDNLAYGRAITYNRGHEWSDARAAREEEYKKEQRNK